MRNILLIVDDIEVNRLQLQEIFRDKYTTVEAVSGEAALKYMLANKNQIAAVLLDIKMDTMNGVMVLEEMRKQSILDTFPIIMITSYNAVELERQCFRLGCIDYVLKPFDSIVVEKRVNNAVKMFRYRDAMNEMMVQEQENRKNLFGQVWMFMANLLEFRSMDNEHHIKRMQALTKVLATHLSETFPKYGLGEPDIELLVQAVGFHDIGKIMIPDSILLKPSRLNQDEFEMMKSHTTKGCEMITKVDFMYSERLRQMCYDVCRSHHERYDGKGYPDGLKGSEIPLVAQIVSVVDAYEALVSERVYKEAFDHETAYMMIMTGECGTFAPDILECLRIAKKEFSEIP